MTKSYIGTKLVKMTPMNRAEYNSYRNWKLPEDENGEDEGYLVEYTDGGKPNDLRHAGYISWSPKQQADNAYREIDGMTFGLAVEAMKKGMKVSRSGWNGKGLFVYYVPPNSYKAQTGVAKQHFGDNAMVPYNAYMAIKNVNGTVSTWVPSVNDCLSEDWNVVE